MNDMKSLFWQLDRLGYVWQFITSNAYISNLFAKNYVKEDMKVNVELVHSRKREIGCDALTHRKDHLVLPSFVIYNSPSGVQWSGADYMDSLMKTVTGYVSSTHTARGKGITEDQFAAKMRCVRPKARCPSAELVSKTIVVHSLPISVPMYSKGWIL